MEHNKKRDKLFPAAAGLILSELVLSGELKAGFLDGSYPGGGRTALLQRLGIMDMIPWVYFRKMLGQCAVRIRFLLATTYIFCALPETIQEQCKAVLDLKDLKIF